MSKWAARMHRRAATLGSVVTSCGHPGPGPYPHRLEKVKFGVSLDEVCKPEIPGPLLVLILKLNKEAPLRKDVFRAPGNQTAIKQLIHFLQAGRLVNVDNYSVYTIASVLKKFLRKLPGGVFGLAGEVELFTAIELADETQQMAIINRLIQSLPAYTQQLLVLLFGTFRVIASNASRADTGMTGEALGVSVAPSFFHTCVSDGKTARMEDVLRFKSATKIMKQIIENFTAYDVFGRENYEYYARVTGRVLRVQDEWIFSFRYPPPPRGKSAQQNYALQLSLQTEKTWLQCECDRWGLNQEESQSTPALLTAGSTVVGNSAISLGIIPEHSLLESCARLSVSLEGPGIFSVSNQSTCSSSGSASRSGSDAHPQQQNQNHMTMDELRAVNRYAESTKSLSFLPQVHERQTARMRTRSEWFLGDGGCGDEDDEDGEHDATTCDCGGGGSAATAIDRRSQTNKASSLDHCHHHPPLHHHHRHHTPNSIISADEMDFGGRLPALSKRPVTQLFETTSGFGIPESERERSGQQLGGGGGASDMANLQQFTSNTFAGHFGLSASAESVNLVRRTSSRRGAGGYLSCGAGNGERSNRHPHRSSSRRNKENGSRPGSFKGHHHHNQPAHQQQQQLLRNSTSNQQNISSNSSIDKVLRRNSKATSEDLAIDERRIGGKIGSGGGDQMTVTTIDGVPVEVSANTDYDDEDAEQSQKKQRIVSFDQGSSDRIACESESENFMDTTTTTTIVGHEELASVLLNKPPRL